MGSSLGYSLVCLRSSVDRVVPLRVRMVRVSFFGGILRVLVKFFGFVPWHIVMKSLVSISCMILFTLFIGNLTYLPSSLWFGHKLLLLL